MRYLPINLDVRGKAVVVVGGGTVAARKSRQLLSAGAKVTVIAPELGKPLITLVGKGRIKHHSRPYRSGDLKGASLAFAATSDIETNLMVAKEAKSVNIPVAVVNAPEAGSFISPAVVSRGDLLLTVSTGGRAPLLSSHIRKELEARYGPEYGSLTELLAMVREKLLTEHRGTSYNKKILQAIIEAGLPKAGAGGKTIDIDTLMAALAESPKKRRQRGTAKDTP